VSCWHRSQHKSFRLFASRYSLRPSETHRHFSDGHQGACARLTGSTRSTQRLDHWIPMAPMEMAPIFAGGDTTRPDSTTDRLGSWQVQVVVRNKRETARGPKDGVM
jgi:hypothetical protein